MICQWGQDTEIGHLRCPDKATYRHKMLPRYYCEFHGKLLREKHGMVNVIKMDTDPFDFERRLGEWADQQFGEGGPMRCLKHLKEEVDEVIAKPDDKLEYADCFMLLIDAFRRSGGSLQELLNACEEKLEICKKRQYHPPDSEGIIRHVK